MTKKHATPKAATEGKTTLAERRFFNISIQILI